MDVSIIILNYHSAYLTKYCIVSIARAMPKAATEIIVVDNASRESLRPIEDALAACALPHQLIRTEKNLGFAGGNNIGIRAAKGKYVLIVNPDIVFYPGTIDGLVAFLEQHPKTAVAAPALQNPDGSRQYSCFRFPCWYTPIVRRTALGKLPWAKRHIRAFEMADARPQTPVAVDWILGACALVRRDAIDQVGLFDERYFLYFEDTDWCVRFHDAGWEVMYVPQAVCTHYYHRESAERPGLRALLSPVTRSHVKSGFKFFWKFRKHDFVFRFYR